MNVLRVKLRRDLRADGRLGDPVRRLLPCDLLVHVPHGAAELTNALAQAAAPFGQTLRAEDQQQDVEELPGEQRQDQDGPGDQKATPENVLASIM